MNSLCRQFFCENTENLFQEVLFFSENPRANWEEISKKVPSLPRGWFELSRISSRDRVEFTRDFWLDRIPYHPSAHPGLFEFFEELDDVAIVFTRSRGQEMFDCELVYSFADNSTFFRGKPPAQDRDVEALKQEMNVNLPRDFFSFAKIHDGFGKLSEMGLLALDQIGDARRRVVHFLLQKDQPIKIGEKVLDPGALIPFYETLGLFSFQCFYTDWYPDQEMGNLYLSGIDSTVSDITDRKRWAENLAFPTFSEWLVDYLQGMNLCT